MTGARLALFRLTTPMAALVLALGASFVILVAVLERRASLSLAADRTLSGAVFGLVLPLLAFATLERATGRVRLAVATNSLARFGFSRRRVAFGMLAASAVVVGVASALLAALAVIAARGSSSATLPDVLTSAWIGMLGGVAYTAWFLLASTFGARGGGRAVALFVDWILGSTTSWLAVPWPRGHLRNLLGSAPVLDMSQSAALIALACLSMIYATVALFRLPE
jgi:hypothetical protein